MLGAVPLLWTILVVECLGMAVGQKDRGHGCESVCCGFLLESWRWVCERCPIGLVCSPADRARSRGAYELAHTSPRPRIEIECLQSAAVVPARARLAFVSLGRTLTAIIVSWRG